ncbi:MAG: T9SS type A sorting domain-containing protein [[Clostridium] fimetarium]|nr:T9SS type A sorting domain-containing protein [Alistipes timonensis]MCM1405534.1 T9SS type A sorting domain-containing protein [[Clostridium] fimetarium]
MRISTITLSLAALASALTATANTFITEKNSTRFSVIPAQLTSDDQPKWTFFNRGADRRYGKGCSFEITNRDFTQSKKITPVLAENAMLVVAEGLYDYYNGSYDSSYFYATQTLFNNDDKYEYMVETLNAAGRPTSVTVLNEDGAAVSVFDFKDKALMDMEGDGQCIIIGGGDKTILLFYLQEINEPWGEYLAAYAVDKATGAVEHLRTTPSGATVAPTLVSGGEPVEIKLGSPAATPLAVAVSNVNGALALNAEIPAGSDSLSLPAGNLPAGIYIVSVAGKEHTKIIVR